MLQTTLTLVNLHCRGKSQPYELSKSKKKKKMTLIKHSGL